MSDILSGAPDAIPRKLMISRSATLFAGGASRRARAVPPIDFMPRSAVTRRINRARRSAISGCA